MVSPPTIQCSLLCLFKSFDDSRNVQNERDPDEDRFGNTMPWAVFSYEDGWLCDLNCDSSGVNIVIHG